ncbi:MAG: glycosyltransferase, partial [Bacillota bacterium]
MPQLGFTEFFVGLTYVVAMGTALFFLDDLFTDAIALIKRLRPREISPHVLKRMQRAPQKHIAILIANWKEADVVGAVVRRNIRSVDYQNYRFFLGVYPNDTTTWMAAKELEKLFPEKVGVVVNSQSGPTSKGQMLNEVARQVLASEDRALKKTDFFLMLDSEDILHPQVLTLLNYYSYEADFLQIPVFPLDASRNSLLRGIYTDEFSEIHTKDLLVQQCLGKAIPAVGVRTGLSRELVVDLRLRQEGSIFKSNTLVEDYH